MKTPKTVKKAMRALGMKKGDKVEKVVERNKTMMKKENEAINKHNKKVYENKKNELDKVANIVKKYENMTARRYNTKMVKA